MEAGGNAILPGRRQTVPRGEIFAFVLAFEKLEVDFEYVAHYKPLIDA